MNIDWPRLLRALTGEPEPPVKPLIVNVPVIQEVPAPATMDNLRVMIAELGKGKTDAEQSKLWYDIEMMAFNELGEVALNTYTLTPDQLKQAILDAYPGVTDLLFADEEYTATDEEGLQKLLARDWTNIVPYVINKSDCDKYGNRLYEHCCRYYGINTVIPVWGMTTQGYHGFNLAILWSKNTQSFYAILIEPQTDGVFGQSGPLGDYKPDKLVFDLAILKGGANVSAK